MWQILLIICGLFLILDKKIKKISNQDLNYHFFEQYNIFNENFPSFPPPKKINHSTYDKQHIRKRSKRKKPPRHRRLSRLLLR